jgi:hypothetical protein
MQVPNFLMLMPRPTSDPTKRRNVKPISESRSIPMSRWRDSRIISTRTTNVTKKNVQKAPHSSRQRTKLGPETHNPTWNTQRPGYACVAVLEQYSVPHLQVQACAVANVPVSNTCQFTQTSHIMHPQHITDPNNGPTRSKHQGSTRRRGYGTYERETKWEEHIPFDEFLTRPHFLEQSRVADNPSRVLDLPARLV